MSDFWAINWVYQGVVNALFTLPTHIFTELSELGVPPDILIQSVGHSGESPSRQDTIEKLPVRIATDYVQQLDFKPPPIKPFNLERA